MCVSTISATRLPVMERLILGWRRGAVLRQHGGDPHSTSVAVMVMGKSSEIRSD